VLHQRHQVVFVNTPCLEEWYCAWFPFTSHY